MGHFALAMLDVDGTLRHSDDWQPGALELLDTLGELGITTALCSGRPVESLARLAHDYPHITYIAAASGANVHRRDADGWYSLHAVYLPPEVVDAVVDGADGIGLELWGYTPQQWLVPAINDLTRRESAIIGGDQPVVTDLHGRHDLVKLLGVPAGDEQEAFLRGLDYDGVAVVRSGPTLIDVVPESATLDKGGSTLIAALGIDWDAVVAVGDGENDIGMLSNAGLACALEPLTIDAITDPRGQVVPCANLLEVRRAIIGEA